MESPLIGNSEPVCPYCSHRLDRMPSRKSRCPACGNHFYVRTRPADRKRVLVTEAGAAEIEEVWAIETGTHEALMAARGEFEEEKRRMAAHLGFDPPDGDVRFALLRKAMREHAARGDWGLYRNTRFAMAEQLRKEGRDKTALATYLEVCYLDLNGPNNNTRDGYVPRFDPKTGFLAPGVLQRARRLVKKLHLESPAVREVFDHYAVPAYEGLRLPFPPAEAWVTISEALFR
ncbi:MAG: hypothetical protein ABID40_04205 [Candidatus Bipolaricaulota bacterium]